MSERVGELDETAVRAAREVRVGVGRLRRRLRETQDRDEVTASQVSVLGRLDREGPRSAAELATAEGVRHQSASLWITALADRGLVERAPDPTDGRRQLVSLAPAGRAYLEGQRAEGEQWLARRIAERLTPHEQATVIEAMALLDRIVTR